MQKNPWKPKNRFKATENSVTIPKAEVQHVLNRKQSTD